MAFSKLLKKYRIEHQISQDSLAKILGTTKQVISNYENAKRSPKINTVIEYAKILNIPVSYFLDDDEAINEKKQQVIKNILFADCDNVTEEMINEVIKYAEFIKEKSK